jgi:hypothetical protein
LIKKSILLKTIKKKKLPFFVLAVSLFSVSVSVSVSFPVSSAIIGKMSKQKIDNKKKVF